MKVPINLLIILRAALFYQLVLTLTGRNTRDFLQVTFKTSKTGNMIFHKYIPGAPLNSYVDCIAYVEGNNKGVGFPKTAMSLVFNLNDSFKLFTDRRFTSYTDYKKYWVAGLQTQPTYVESYGESKMIVIQFKTLGSYAFLKQPLHCFRNNYTYLDCVLKKEAEETWEQLQEAATINEKLLLTEKFLYRRLLTAKLPNNKLLASIDAVLQKSDNIPITEICREHNISRKHLNFLFREYLGISPKTLSSLYRFQSVLDKIGKTRPGKLTAIAYDLNFFDQAHFNNDFRRFTGITPNEYINNFESVPALRLIPHFLPVA